MEFYRWNIAKYRLATRHLNTLQHGGYRLLIDEYMDTRQPLPDNDHALANICKMSFDDWMLHASSILRAFFQSKGGVLFHEYCDAELAFQDGTSKFMSDRAKKAADKRWAKNKELDATSMPVAMLGDARQEIRDKREEKERKKDTPLPPEGDGQQFEKFWSIYPKTRREPKLKVLPAYRKALALATEEEIYSGVVRYAASDEVARGFGKGAIAWLNAGRWTVSYLPIVSGNQKPQIHKPVQQQAERGWDVKSS